MGSFGISLDGSDLANVLKTFEERLNQEQVNRERIEASLTEEKTAREALETRFAEEQKAREDMEARLAKEQSAREALESRLIEAMKGKANGTDLLAVNSLLPGKVSAESFQVCLDVHRLSPMHVLVCVVSGPLYFGSLSRICERVVRLIVCTID
jgi:hypothetical protein